KRPLPASFFAPESGPDALNSPVWFPWHQGGRHLNCNMVEEGIPSWLLRDRSEGDIIRGTPQKDKRPRSARPRRKIDERQSAQFRPLGYHCPVAVGAVHALP